MSLQGNSGVFEMEYTLVSILFAYVVFLNIKNKTIVVGNILIPLLIFLLYSLLSITWTPVKPDGFKGFLAMLEGYMVYYILTNGFFKIKKKHLLNISKIATYVMISLSFEIIYIYSYYGFETVIHSKNLVHLGWGYSNFIAVIFVLLIPVALYKYLDNKRYYLQYFLLDIISIISLILTLSRGAIVGAAVALTLFFIIYVRKYFLIRYGSIIGVISLIVIKIQKVNSFYSSIIDRFFTGEFMDNNGRFPLYKLAFEKFVDKIWFGNGLRSSKYMISHFLDGHNSHYHNFILQIAATLGIVGLILFSFIVFRWVKVLFKPYDKFVVCSAISIIGALAHQMVDVSFDLFYFGVYFYTIIATVEIYRHNLKSDSLKLKYIGKIKS